MHAPQEAWSPHVVEVFNAKSTQLDQRRTFSSFRSHIPSELQCTHSEFAKRISAVCVTYLSEDLPSPLKGLTVSPHGWVAFGFFTEPGTQAAWRRSFEHCQTFLNIEQSLWVIALVKDHFPDLPRGGHQKHFRLWRGTTLQIECAWELLATEMTLIIAAKTQPLPNLVKKR